MKLKQRGQWYWRKDELSLKEFRQLSSTEREEHLTLLQGLKPEELSTNDIYILNQYSVVIINNNKFLEL
jgi:hypothetical protein